MAGIGAFSALPTNTVGEQSLAMTRTAGDSYHPGPPRVMHAGERLVDPLTPDYKGDGSPDGRRTLSPRIPERERDPDSHGPEVELTGADSVGTAFMAPEVEEASTLTFELSVDDGQGKTATDTVNVTIQPETGGTTTTTMDGGATTETDTEADATTDTGDGDGPGFSIVSGALGAAGGAAYAARSLLGDVAEQGPDESTDGES